MKGNGGAEQACFECGGGVARMKSEDEDEDEDEDEESTSTASVELAT
jgi:hypothetical protein